jgi:hypothetical protein
MGLLSGFAKGASEGIQGGWEDNRQEAMEQARQQMKMRLQDRAVSLNIEEDARIREQELADRNDPNSVFNIDRRNELADKKALLSMKGTATKAPSWKSVKVPLPDGGEGEVLYDPDSGQYRDPSGIMNKPSISESEAMAEAEMMASDKAKLLNSDAEDFGMDRDLWIKTEAERIMSESTLAYQLGINSAPASNGGSAPTVRLSRDNKEQAPNKPQTSPVKPANDSAKQEEDALLAEFGLNVQSNDNSGGLLGALKDDPVTGTAINAVGKAKDAANKFGSFVSKTANSAMDAINTPPNISPEYRKKLELTLNEFRKSPTVQAAQEILHSGLVTGREKKAIEIFIERNK